MSSIVFQQSLGVGLVAREVDDAVGDFGGGLEFARLVISERSLARDAKHLLYARPTPLLQEDIESDGRLDGPLLAATVAFVVRGVTLAFKPTLLGLDAGGELTGNRGHQRRLIVLRGEDVVSAGVHDLLTRFQIAVSPHRP